MSRLSRWWHSPPTKADVVWLACWTFGAFALAGCVANWVNGYGFGLSV